MEVTLVVLFIIGYLLITLEHTWDIHKSVTAAALGASLWFIIALREGDAVKHTTEALGSEIFGLILFLFAAMTLVELLVHYRFFDWIRVRLLSLGLNDYKQLWLIGALSFVLSAIIDNLTTTIVMIQIARRFFKGKNLLVTVSAIVIAANAGGAFSPLGDVTTIMLWLAKKFTWNEIIGNAFLPSLGLWLTSMYLLTRMITTDTRDVKEESVRLARSERVIIGVGMISFLFPVVFKELGLEPYFGLLFGLGLTGLTSALFRAVSKRDTHLTADITTMLVRVDFASLLFFSGILLAVGALEHVGILEAISHSLFGEHATFARYVIGSSALGIFSAVIDNIPLTAAAIDILKTTDPAIWSLLAFAVGTGGSLLVIGSAAGVVAMGMIKELTFFRYITIAMFPAFIGYAVGIAIWYVQYQIMH
ncbi:sodium:proton antiporter NhaD [Candidatus Uhrbacteria bacterium]|nr:sodium:proton antiporter NhaD [Candidatus Uhrbacteria bacterium]